MPLARAPKLLDLVRQALRLRHYSVRTEQAYVLWIRRFILFHKKRHPSELGAAEVQAFLVHLAQDLAVSAGTQNQALAALVFLYNDVLAIGLAHHVKLIRTRPQERIPVVLTPGRGVARPRPIARRPTPDGKPPLRRRT